MLSGCSQSWVLALLGAHCSRAFPKGLRPGCHAVGSLDVKNGCPQSRCANHLPQEEGD